MKYDQYVSLIQGLENYARTNRKAYEYKVLGLALLGYGYFIGLILLFLAIPVALGLLLWWAPAQLLRLALVLGKLAWILVPVIAAFFGFLGGAIKAMFAKFPEPEGRELSREEAPELFAFIETTCKELRAKRPVKVLVTDELNAAVASLPRFGMFGHKVYMLLGLPLMQALSTDQFKAVLAHEIGHISERHGAFAKWAYQLREAWGRFIESQEAHEHKFAALYEKFVNWFFPYFTAYSFVLMREHEKDADRYSVQLVGAKPMGEALVALETQTATLNEVFWAQVHEENVAQPTAPKRIFSRMLAALRADDRDHEAKTLTRAVQVPTDYADSHPSLAERLRFIGYWQGDGLPDLPTRSGETAAEFFFGDRAKEFVTEFDIGWDEKIEKDWRTRHEHFQKSDKRIAELETKGAQGELSVEELLEKASLIAEKKGNDQALPLLQQIVQRFPEHAEANYFLGGLMLSSDDEGGLEHVRKAMELDDKWRFAASDLAFQYLRSKGRLDEARTYARAMEEEEESLQKAELERQGVAAGDRFERAEIGQEVVDKIVSKLKYFDEIHAIYLVRKVVEHRPDIPFNVLFLDVQPSRERGAPKLGPEDILKIAVERLEGEDIGYLAVLTKELEKLVPQLDSIDGAKILSR